MSPTSPAAERSSIDAQLARLHGLELALEAIGHRGEARAARNIRIELEATIAGLARPPVRRTAA